MVERFWKQKTATENWPTRHYLALLTETKQLALQHLHHLGDSQEIQFDEKGNPKFETGSEDGTRQIPKKISAYDTKSVPAFTTHKQLGLANKI